MNYDVCERLAVACPKMSSIPGKEGVAAKTYRGFQNGPVFLGQPVDLGARRACSGCLYRALATECNQSLESGQRFWAFRQQISMRLKNNVVIDPTLVASVSKQAQQFAHGTIRLRCGEQDIGIQKYPHDIAARVLIAWSRHRYGRPADASVLF